MSSLNIYTFFEFFYNRKRTIEEFAVHFESIDQDYPDLDAESLEKQDIARYRRTFHRYKNKLADEYQIDMEMESYTDRVKKNRSIPVHYISKDIAGNTDSFLRLAHYHALNQLFSGDSSSFQEKNDYIFTEDRSQNFEGSRHLNILLSAIRTENKIQFNYRSRFIGKVKEHRISPHFLKEYSGRWYVVGIRPNDDKPYMYGLDRIEELKVLDDSFERIPNLHDKIGYDRIVGVELRADKKIQQIKIRISAQVAPYFESLPIHSSQVIYKREKEFWYFKYSIIPNSEFYQLLLMWVEHIAIIEPHEVRQEYLDLLQRGTELNE